MLTQASKLISLSLVLGLATLGACDDPQSAACDDPSVGVEDDRGSTGKADGALHGSCEDACGGKATGGTCYCDAQCAKYGDCCGDYEAVCLEPEPEPELVCAGTLFVLANEDGVHRLYRGSVLDATLETVGPIEWDSDLWELAAVSPNLAYAVDRSQDILVGIDLGTAGIVSQVALDADMHNNGRGLFVRDGELFGLFERDDLRRIDPTTGATTTTATLSGIDGASESMVFCGGAVLAAASPEGSPQGQNLYEVAADGALSLRGPIGDAFIDIDTLSCGGMGQLYGVDTHPEIGRDLHQIDAATGTRIFLASLPVAGGINGLQVVSF